MKCLVYENLFTEIIYYLFMKGVYCSSVNAHNTDSDAIKDDTQRVIYHQRKWESLHKTVKQNCDSSRR